jgi:hypothetical protein
MGEAVAFFLSEGINGLDTGQLGRGELGESSFFGRDFLFADDFNPRFGHGHRLDSFSLRQVGFNVGLLHV